MRPEPTCLIDRSRRCGSCIAASPRECPYGYLLDPDELSAIAVHGGSAVPVTAAPAGPSSAAC